MRRATSQEGFTLIEVAVAGIVGTALIVAAGGVGLTVYRQRATYDSISAATSLAERQYERLRDIQNPGTDAAFTNGNHTATNSPMKEDGTSNGPFNVTWAVADVFPAAMAGVKKITIQVTHSNNPAVNVSVVTYYKAS